MIADFAQSVRTTPELAALVGSRWGNWRDVNSKSLGCETLESQLALQAALMEVVLLYADPRSAQDARILQLVRSLTVAAFPAGIPVAWDPFAGGGSIPVEGLRLGYDVLAADLNPISVLLNRIAVEYIPKYGDLLTQAFDAAASRIAERAKEALRLYYPSRAGGVPIVYLWARQVRCEGPSCGIEIPLIRSLQVTRTGDKWYFQLVVDSGRIAVHVRKGTANQAPTVAGGAATCPKCNFTTRPAGVREQLRRQSGGANSARLLAIYVDSQAGRQFFDPTAEDIAAFALASDRLDRSDIPVEEINPTRPHKNTRGLSAVTRIGIERFCDLYNPRQALALQVLRRLIAEENSTGWTPELRRAVQSLLLCAMSRLVFQNCSLSRWHSGRSTVEGAFGKQALQVVWDFAESNPVAEGPANWSGAVGWIDKVLDALKSLPKPGNVALSAAQDQVLPDDSVDVLFTDPPYFAAIPYSDLSNVFYVWERPLLRVIHPDLYHQGLVDQDREVIVTDANAGPSGEKKDKAFFQREMTASLEVARRVVKPGGIGIVVFADSTTDAWEAILGAIIDAGWIITGSWPLDTELQSRTQAAGSASLQSSIHIVCRPREAFDGTHRLETVGDWRTVLAELPTRIHNWMPRLANEGVVGADAIFACLGPALEIFSRYSRVEKASGDTVLLRDYLEHVWAAVAKEALAMIFAGADATGFEEDARLTAMWLWTLSTGGTKGSGSGARRTDDGEPESEEDDGTATKARVASFVLEYDAARKIAQGLGAHLQDLTSLVEVKGATARLLPVAERTRSLFLKGEPAPHTSGGRAKKTTIQLSLGFIADLDQAEAETPGGWGEAGAALTGKTVLDRVHQAMILFGAGRGEALKRFLIDDGVGRDERFWRLAQAFSALYPAATDEKRWVDGVLARKRGLGL